jgi:hypothetical protein
MESYKVCVYWQLDTFIHILKLHVDAMFIKIQNTTTEITESGTHYKKTKMTMCNIQKWNCMLVMEQNCDETFFKNSMKYVFFYLNLLLNLISCS